MSQNVTVPVEMVNKLDAIARAMLTLAKDLKERAKVGDATPTDIPIPDLTPPDHIAPEDAWFWSDTWQKMEREANEDLRAGRVSVPFSTAEEAIAHLDGQV